MVIKSADSQVKVADEDFKDCLDAQFNDLITKPIDIVKLKKIILHLGKKKMCS